MRERKKEHGEKERGTEEGKAEEIKRERNDRGRWGEERNARSWREGYRREKEREMLNES